MGQFVIRRRVTSTLLDALPPTIKHFDAHLYAIIPRKEDRICPGQYGSDVRIDPCILDWASGTITMTIPLDINPGLAGLEDLDPDFFEAVQAAFLALAHACI